MIISHLSGSNVFKGLIVVSVLLVGGFFVSGAQAATFNATFTSANPTGVDSSFTPSIGASVVRSSTAYIGRTTTYVGSPIGTSGDTIKWKVTITGPESVLTPSMIDLDEVGFNDPGGAGVATSTFHYPFTAGSATNQVVALGSCDAADLHDDACAHDVGFSLDENDVFTNADSIKFNSSAPLGNYTIAYQLVDTKGTVGTEDDDVSSDTYTISVDVTLEPVLNVTTNSRYLTIQDAINAASSGNTINVAAGTYNEAVTINKSVTLVGDVGDSSAGPGPSAPLLDGQSILHDAFTISAGVSGVTIKGFEIANYVGPGNGVGNAIQAWNSGTSNIEISDNYMHDLDWNGVLVGNDGATGDHNNWLIKNNVLENYVAYGLELTNASNSSFEDNVIHASNSWTSILVVARRNETGITIKYNLIDGSIDDVGTSGRAAIYILGWGHETPGAQLSSVMVENNQISTTGTKPHVRVREVQTGQVTGVTVKGNSLSTLENLAVAQVNAANNWWGNVSGPNHATNPSATGGTVSDNVTFLPWCSSAECTSTLGGLTLSSTEPAVLDVVGGTVVDNGDFTSQELGLVVNLDSDVYLGLNAVSSLDMSVYNIVWKFVIDGPSPLNSSMVDVQEVGWFDQNECGILESVGTCPNPAGDSYTFSVVDGNLVAYGSGGTFDSDPADEFVTVSRIHFNSTAPLGSYTITYQIVGRDVTNDDTTDAIPFNTLSAPDVAISAPSEMSFTLLNPETQTLLNPVTELSGLITEVVVTENNPTSIISADTSLIDATVNLAGLVTITGDLKTATLTGGLTINADNTSFGQIAVEIPAGTSISATTDWTGVINVPKILQSAAVNPNPSSGNQISQVLAVVEIGFGDVSLNLTNGVRILIPTQAGKKVGFSRGTFIEITSTCLADTQAAGDALAANGTCKWNAGTDLVVWTKHFTQFITYTEVAAVVRTGGGGGGGGGGTTTPTPTVTTPTQTVAVTTPAAGQVLGVTTFSFTQTLKTGSEGNDVTELQNRLTAEGVYSGPVTGYFGPLTEAGVKAFQAKYGIEQAGIVGPLTRTKLNESVAVVPAPGQVLGATTVDKTQLQAQLASLQEQLKELLQKLVEAMQNEVNRQLKLSQ